MLVLHGVWARPGVLGVWAECMPAAEAAPDEPPVSDEGPHRHPFAATASTVREIIGTIGSTSTTLVLSLPTHGEQPDASHQLWDAPMPVGRARVRDWTVPAAVVRTGVALDVIRELRVTAGVAIGESLAALAEVADMAVELARGGRVLPALVPGDDGWRARWRSVPTPAALQAALALAQALPGAVMAATPARTDAVTVVREIVDAFVDSHVREALSSFPVVVARRGRRSASEAWLAALTTPDGRVRQAGEDDLVELAEALTAWHRSADVGVADLRLCLRLVDLAENADGEGEDTTAPAQTGPSVSTSTGPSVSTGTGDFRLEALLQDVADPSLLVPAAELWDGSPSRDLLTRRDPYPEERLLEQLARASRLYPPVGRMLAGARPEPLDLDGSQALEFLEHGAALLDTIGVAALVPPWWRESKRRLGARLRISTPAPTGGVAGNDLGLAGLVSYRWEIALGDDSLTAEELVEMARLKQPLVRVKGRWTIVDQRDVEAALRFLRKRAKVDAAIPAGDPREGFDGAMSIADALQAALGVRPSETGLAVVAVEADGWLGELLDGSAERRVELGTAPDGFCGTLRPYQERGLAWLRFLAALGVGACLADDMGLGKTAQLLALLVAEQEDPALVATPGMADGLGPTLVVCPMSVVGNWQREAQRFAPGLRVMVHHGQQRHRGAKFSEAVGDADLVLTTYPLVVRDHAGLASVRWRRIVLDEAQNVKNPAARQSKAVRSLPAEHRVALTGTPVENRLQELWSIMEFLNPGLLGPQARFRERFAIPIERLGDEDAAERLRRVTRPLVLRRLKTDKRVIDDLPEKIEMKVYCNLTAEQASLYQAIVDDAMERLDERDGMARKGLVLVTMLKLKQVCNHPAHLLGDRSRLDGRSGKLERLVETLEEVVAEGDRALVFTQFAEMGDMLRPHLQERLGVETLWLHGGVTKKHRDTMVDRFQAADGPGVFLLSLKAGGTGLNLTAANHVIHFDRWWNPAVEEQATDRAFRIGQLRNVQVRKLICVGTLEERIDAMIERKRALADRIVGTGESWLTELSTSELREVFALSSDAVSE